MNTERSGKPGVVAGAGFSEIALVAVGSLSSTRREAAMFTSMPSLASQRSARRAAV